MFDPYVPPKQREFPPPPARSREPLLITPTLVLAHVTHYRHDKGFGFCETETGEQVFFHRSIVAPRALQALDERYPGPLNVDLKLEMAERGLRATYVGASQFDCYNAKGIRYTENG